MYLVVIIILFSYLSTCLIDINLLIINIVVCFFFASRRRHTICLSDWSSDVCSSDLHFDGVLGVAAVDFSDGHTFSHNGDAVFTTASSIKIPILIELFQAERQHQIRLSDREIGRASCRERVEGAVGATPSKERPEWRC